MVDRLFVYGTLCSGHTARSLIAEHVARSEPATTAGHIYAFSDGYPGLVDGDDHTDDHTDKGTVVGELLHLADLTAVFALLDAYEGADFTRVMRQVTTASGNQWTWCYVLADSSFVEEGELVESGDWSAVGPAV